MTKSDDGHLRIPPFPEEFQINPVDNKARLPETNDPTEALKGNIIRNQRGSFTGIVLTRNQNIQKP